MATQPSRVEAIFTDAVTKPTPAERAAFLNQACGDDAPLRERVEALLHAHDNAGSFLQLPGTDARTALAAIGEGPGAVVGRYKLLEQIGEGGFGVVFMAEQKEPVRRKVALKVIKLGMDTKQVVGRFEAERQALALMDHPNIAKVLDGGATEEGRPYFVMELVHGIPITHFCDENKLTTRQRLELFVQVCSALQHAHQKGIIHRDLKPGNVLVTMHDDKPVPKIIDFGVAKAINQRLTEHTVFTEFRQLIGTPAYMSPEQAQMSGLDVDTRSDIYSAGVLLYELLTGATPFDPSELRDAACAEMQRIIREVEPPAPSTRLSTLAAGALKSVAERRRCDPKALGGLLKGELDWIIMKCLEKDRSRRYETVNGLARDIQRYLSDEPVEACPPSTTYRLRKLFRKHKREAVAALAVIIALVLGVLGTSIGLWRAQINLTAAKDAEQHARQSAHEMEVERNLAAANETKARGAERRETSQRKQAEAVAGILDSIFQRLDPYRQDKDAGDLRSQLVKQLDNIAAAIEKDQAGEPLVRARLRDSLGWTELRLGEVNKAEKLLELAIEDSKANGSSDDAQKFRILYHQGVAHQQAGRYLDSIELLEQVRDWQTKNLNANSADSLAALRDLADAYETEGRTAESVQLYEQVRDRQIATIGPDATDTLVTQRDLAHTLGRGGRTAEATQSLKNLYDRLVNKLGATHPDTLITLRSLADEYCQAGQAARAVALLEQIRDQQISRLGPEHMDVLHTLTELGWAYRQAGRLSDAIKLLEQLLETESRKLGEDHPWRDIAANNLADAYEATGRIPDAVEMFEKLYAQRLHRLGPGHPSTINTQYALSRAYEAEGQYQKAVDLLEQVRDQRIARLGSDHPDVLITLGQLGSAYQDIGRDSDAITVLEQVRVQMMQDLGPNHRFTLVTMHNLALAYGRVGRHEEAIDLLQKVINVQKEEGSFFRATTESVLAAEYRRAGRVAEAIELFEQARLETVQRLGPNDPDSLAIAYGLAQAYGDAGRTTDAIVLMEQVQRGAIHAFGPDHPHAITSSEELESLYRKVGRSTDAAKLFREVMRGKLAAKNRDLAIHPSDPMLLADRGHLYARMGRFAEAAADFRKALDLKPDDQMNWHCYVPLLLVLGDVDAYREWRSKQLQRFQDVAEGSAADDVAKDYLMLPAVGDELRTVTELADRAFVESRPDKRFASLKGLTEYRRGNYREAIGWLHEESYSGTNPLDNLWTTRNLLLMSMCYSKLGEQPMARLALGNASRAAAKLPRAGEDDLDHRFFMDWISCQTLRREAVQMIGVVEPATKPADLPKMSGLADGWQWTASKRMIGSRIEYLSRKLEQNLEAPVAAATRYARAGLYVRLADFDHALSDYRRAIELAPDNHLYWHDGFIPLILQAGDLDGYRVWRNKELRQFRNTTDAGTAHRVSKDAMMTPLDGEDLKIAVALADRAVAKEGDSWGGCQTKGMAEYRSGHFQAAISFLIKSRDLIHDSKNPTIDEFFIAMSYERAGNREKARESLDRARQDMADLPSAREYGFGSSDWILCQVVRQEAEALFNKNGPATKPASSTQPVESK